MKILKLILIIAAYCGSAFPCIETEIDLLFQNDLSIIQTAHSEGSNDNCTSCSICACCSSLKSLEKNIQINCKFISTNFIADINNHYLLNPINSFWQPPKKN